MEEEIRAYINSIASEKGVEIDDNIDLYKCGVMDSMEMILFLTFLNEKLHIKIDFSDLDFENFISVNAITKWLAKDRRS